MDPHWLWYQPASHRGCEDSEGSALPSTTHSGTKHGRTAGRIVFVRAPTWLEIHHNDYLLSDLTSALELTACAWLGRFNNGVDFPLDDEDRLLVDKWTEFARHGLENIGYNHRITLCILLETCAREFQGLRLKLWAKRSRDAGEMECWRIRLYLRLEDLSLEGEHEGAMDTAADDGDPEQADSSTLPPAHPYAATDAQSITPTQQEKHYRPPIPEPDYDPERPYAYTVDEAHAWLEYHANSISVRNNRLFVQGRERGSSDAFRMIAEDWQRRRLAGSNRAGDMMRGISSGSTAGSGGGEEEGEGVEGEQEMMEGGVQEDEIQGFADERPLAFRTRPSTFEEDDERQDEGAICSGEGMALPIRGRVEHDIVQQVQDEGEEMREHEAATARAQSIGGSRGSLGGGGQNFGDM
ncbi:hypothetical protein LTR86_007214 [Recurvomyces mirabilis]|nr:hypothetical protein LTR86_007214 [Recurvomyces mirabilis]